MRKVRSACQDHLVHDRVGLALAVMLLAAALHAPAASAAARVTVALEGDSVVEGNGTPRGDLATWVRWELGRLGASVGANGHTAAHVSEFTRAPGGEMLSFPWTYSPGWSLKGLGLAEPSAYGANGRMSQTGDPSAIASAELAGDQFAVLFARSPNAGRFAFSVDDRTVRVDARATHVDGKGIRWVNAPAAGSSTHRLAVRGPDSGTLRFTGVIARTRVTPGATQIEVSGVGQACACATDPLPRTRAQAVELLRPDITLIMLGINGEGRFVATGDDQIKTDYVAGLEKRARIARRHGGVCVVVPHAPDPQPPAAQRLFETLADRKSVV